LNKETKALAMVGNKVTEVKAVSMNTKKTSSASESDKFHSSTIGTNEDATQAEDRAFARRQELRRAKSGKTATRNTSNKGSSSVGIAIGSFFAAVAVLGIFVAVAIPAYQDYLRKTNAAKIIEQFRINGPDRSWYAYSDNELSAIASQENVALPKMVDKTTRLDSAVGVSNELQYNYTLLDISSDSVSWASLKNTLEKSMVNWVCTTKHFVEAFISKGVTVSFAYFGNDRRLIGVLSVEPFRCASARRAAE
jgi:hypothetical protein